MCVYVVVYYYIDLAVDLFNLTVIASNLSGVSSKLNCVLKETGNPSENISSILFRDFSEDLYFVRATFPEISPLSTRSMEYLNTFLSFHNKLMMVLQLHILIILRRTNNNDQLIPI